MQQRYVGQMSQLRSGVRRCEHAQFAQDFLLDDVSSVDVTGRKFGATRAIPAADVTLRVGGVIAAGNDPTTVVELQKAENDD